MGANGFDDVGASIRACVATPSRVVLFFDGEPQAEAVHNGSSYHVGRADDRNTASALAVAEYDAGARIAVIPNPLGDVSLGDWLRVTVRVQTHEPPIEHFVRVESELPLLYAVLGEKGLGGTGLHDKSTAVEAVRRVDSIDTSADPTGPSVAPTKSPADPRPDEGRPRFSPGLVVVVAGLISLIALGVVAMLSASAGEMGTIATAAFGVIGSVTGAFFGVHAGLGERERVDDGRHVEAVKAQKLAAMMPEESKQAALDMLSRQG